MCGLIGCHGTRPQRSNLSLVRHHETCAPISFHSSVGVDSSHQGTGSARLHLESRSRNREGCSRLRLSYRPANLRMEVFHQRLGPLVHDLAYDTKAEVSSISATHGSDIVSWPQSRLPGYLILLSLSPPPSFERAATVRPGRVILSLHLLDCLGEAIEAHRSLSYCL